MATTKALVTAEELACMPDEDCRRELLDGVVVELPFNGGLHGATLTHVGIALYQHAELRGLGTVLVGSTGIILRRNPDRVRAPDACFIRTERLPDGVTDGYLELVPDLIVEVVSPTDGATDLQQKVKEWLRAGARLVWILYPERRAIGVAEMPGLVRFLHEDDTLTGEPVLPGFSVPVAELFS